MAAPTQRLKGHPGPYDPPEVADVLGPRPSGAPARRAWATAATLIERTGAITPVPRHHSRRMR
jgi:hypothetical protein